MYKATHKGLAVFSWIHTNTEGELAFFLASSLYLKYPVVFQHIAVISPYNSGFGCGDLLTHYLQAMEQIQRGYTFVSKHNCSCT